MATKEAVKHTPGPWELVNDSREGWFEIRISGEGESYKVICGRSAWPRNAEQSTANARLIAAAPEMLEALKEIVDYYESSDHAYNDHCPICKAEALIAKVEGK